MSKKPITLWQVATFIIVAMLGASCASTANQTAMNATPKPSVANFHERASAGEPVDVVFFGGSLTWGANASDPNKTSYRGRMMQWLREQYPNTPITFHDAAIGGTNSQLGLFRLQRDVLAHDPDLVFIDFTVNDGAGEEDAEKFASYETLIRTMTEKDIPVMPVLLMFKWHAKEPGADLPARHQGHLALGEKYNLPVANVIPYVSQQIDDGNATVEALWPFDGAHPDDPGYELFFEAVRDRYLTAANDSGMSATIPDSPVYGERYPERTRLILSEQKLPDGWEVKKTYRTSLWYDGLASRWIGDVATASKQNNSEAIEIDFDGSLVGFFGEQNGLTPDVRIWIDGKPIAPPKAKDGDVVWPLGTERFAPPKKGSGNLFMWTLIADDLKDGPHTIKIEPIWENADDNAELRIESICSAGQSK